MILTATLSPRLRVDNGVKIWWCTGQLLHVQMTDELYQATWRPVARNAVPQFPNNIPPAPAPSSSTQALPIKAPASKPAGAYRPPGALGRAAPSIFKREDETGGSGAQTPPRGVPGSMGYNDNNTNDSGRGTPNGYGRGRGDTPRGRGQGGRQVPGAPPVVSPTNTPPPEGARRKKAGKGRRDEGEGGNSGTASGRQTPMDGYATPNHNQQGHDNHRQGRGPNLNTNAQGMGKGKTIPMPAKVEEALLSVAPDAASPTSPGGDGTLDPVQKKIRNLSKKV
jgi:translation initiation factor 2A